MLWTKIQALIGIKKMPQEPDDEEWGELDVVTGPWGGPSIVLEWGCKVFPDKPVCPGPWEHYAHNHLQDQLLNLNKRQAKQLFEALKRFV